MKIVEIHCAVKRVSRLFADFSTSLSPPFQVSVYSGTSIWRRAKGLAKFVRYNEVLLTYIEVLFHIPYYYWGKENRSLNRGLRYIVICYIEVPLSCVILGQCIGAGGGCQPLVTMDTFCSSLMRLASPSSGAPKLNPICCWWVWQQFQKQQQ